LIIHTDQSRRGKGSWHWGHCGFQPADGAHQWTKPIDRCLYSILEVTPAADKKKIKAQYYRLSQIIVLWSFPVASISLAGSNLCHIQNVNSLHSFHMVGTFSFLILFGQWNIVTRAYANSLFPLPLRCDVSLKQPKFPLVGPGSFIISVWNCNQFNTFRYVSDRDRNDSHEAKVQFMAIADACMILGNDFKRQEYDLHCHCVTTSIVRTGLFPHMILNVRRFPPEIEGISWVFPWCGAALLSSQSACVGTGRVGDYNYRYFMCSRTEGGIRKGTTRKEESDEEDAGCNPLKLKIRVHLDGGTKRTILKTLGMTSAVKRADLC
jgi:curved DNA-binding protein CbpA